MLTKKFNSSKFSSRCLTPKLLQVKERGFSGFKRKDRHKCVPVKLTVCFSTVPWQAKLVSTIGKITVRWKMTFFRNEGEVKMSLDMIIRLSPQEMPKEVFQLKGGFHENLQNPQLSYTNKYRISTFVRNVHKLSISKIDTMIHWETI